ncbi:MAG: outer membrane protein assembly factor BamD [Thermoanaerobaculia bacterium]|nr:outer membrane protein assembly factor BamD [Thermoanaerobaculia bacterium]
MSRRLAAALAAGLLAFVVGCGGGSFEDDPLLALSAEEALAQGKALMEEGKYRRAEEYLNHAFEVEPNSPSGREALLLAADALFEAGGDDSLLRAEAKYRDFQNRFPTSARGDYVLFQIAASLQRRMRSPDRDQEPTRKALAAYQEVIALYPTSEYAERARAEIDVLRHQLAESEFLVGRFYHRIGLHPAAVARFEGLLENYPGYPGTDRTLYLLGRSQLKMKRAAAAAETFDRLRSEFPESPYLEEIPDFEVPPPVAEEAGEEGSEPEPTEAPAEGDGSS